MGKSPEAFRTISEVAKELDVPQHVLRFWEGKFAHIKPMKRGGGRRYYRPHDIELLRGIRVLLYGEGYTIRGVQKILRDQGMRHVAEIGSGGTTALPPAEPQQARPLSAPAFEESDQGEAKGLSEQQIRLLRDTLSELAELKKILDN